VPSDITTVNCQNFYDIVSDIFSNHKILSHAEVHASAVVTQQVQC